MIGCSAPGEQAPKFDVQEARAIAAAVAGLDAWLDAMRQPGGYGGPVVHWWRNCLDYTGPGLDWRYAASSSVT